MHHMWGHCFCTTWDNQGDCSVPPGWLSSANLSQTGWLAAESPTEADIALAPSPTLLRPLSISLPSHSHVTLQSIAPWADEEGQFPLLPKGPHVSMSCYYEGENFIHFPTFFSFSISHRALNHCCLWEMLEPWQACCGCHGLLQE